MSATSRLPKAEPSDIGLSSERLARIKPAMQEFIDRKHVPCVLTLVARHGKIAHLEVQGMMDVENGKPASEDTIFQMYSMTKPITGLATLLLYEDGYFHLDDPVSKFLPEFRNPVVSALRPPKGYVPPPSPFGLTVPARREITIRDCLRHTTGLPSGRRTPIGLLGPFRHAMQGIGLVKSLENPDKLPASWNDLGRDPTDEPVTMSETVQRLAAMPLEFHPGSDWEYGFSNDVAGVLVEEITGMTLDEFFRERIFEPLGMSDTSFYLPEEKLERFSTCYVLRNDEDQFNMVAMDAPENSEKVKGPKVLFSGGGMYGGVLSTIEDYAKFAQMLLNGGDLDGTRLLTRETVDLMTTNHTGDLRGQGDGWGLGVGVRTSLKGQSAFGSIGEYGWGGAACTQYFADPSEDLFGLMFSQVTNAGINPDMTIMKDFQRLVYLALE